jgi:rhodanese-related sulfurtransferase
MSTLALVPGTQAVYYIEPHELASALHVRMAVAPTVLILDVRDDDAEIGGGRIKGGAAAVVVGAPACRFEAALAESGVALADFERVVVHCSYSKSRGPRCAALLDRLYPLRARSFQLNVLRGGFLYFASSFPDLIE